MEDTVVARASGAQWVAVPMSINQLRDILYLVAKLLGDVNAAAKGRIGQRVARRVTGKLTGRLLGRLFRR